MLKLNPTEIKFIDTYLENSEVNFADIRMEMVDHVASDIESEINAGDSRSFYDIFKDYMLANKATLLRNNKQSYLSLLWIYKFFLLYLVLNILQWIN